MPSWRSQVLPLAALLAIGAVAYSSSLSGGFVYDDVPSILETPDVQDASHLLDAGRILRGEFGRPGRAVAYATFTLNHAVGGDHPLGYRLTNLAIHLTNAFLLFALVLVAFRTPQLRDSRLSRLTPSIAFLAAILFVAHPIQTQAVAYIVQRITSLATLFFLVANLCYIAFRLTSGDTGNRVRRALLYGGAFLATVLAMRTKEISFTLPLTLVLAEALLFGRGGWRRYILLLPFLVTMAIIPYTLLSQAPRQAGASLVDTAARATQVQVSMSRWDYLATEATVIARYLGLLLLPIGQNADPDVPIARSFLEPAVASSVVLLALLAAGAGWFLYRARRGRADPAGALVAFGIAWFFVTMSVESSVIPIVDVMNEHRVYLPSVGFFLAVATVAGLLADALAKLRAAAILGTVTVVFGVALGTATWFRGQVWVSELTLWQDTASKSPRKARPLTNLGAALTEAGELGQAEQVLRTAVTTNPLHADAWFNLGNVYLTQPSRIDEASRFYARALEISPGHAGARSNLAGALLRQRRFLDVIELLRATPGGVRLSPEALFNLGVAFTYAGDQASAKRQLDLLTPMSPALASRLKSFMSGFRN